MLRIFGGNERVYAAVGLLAIAAVALLYFWQYFVLDDSTQPTPPGDYIIRVTVNPPYLPDSTDACPVRDEQNFCRVLRESNYSDNVATLHITLP